MKQNNEKMAAGVDRQVAAAGIEHPVASDELRAIKRYFEIRTDAPHWLFLSEREQPLARQSVNYLTATAAKRAELPPVHPHIPRQSCGFYLANRRYYLRLIQDYPGHRDPKHTVRYRVASVASKALSRARPLPVARFPEAAQGNGNAGKSFRSWFGRIGPKPINAAAVSLRRQASTRPGSALQSSIALRMKAVCLLSRSGIVRQ
jgi:hypothetical protein